MNILNTKRLELIRVSEDDAPFIFKLVNTPTFIKYIGDRGVETLDDAKKYILDGPVRSYREFGFGLFLMKLKNDDIPIGMCGLLKRKSLPDVDIGFAIMPEYEKRGYTYEASSAVMEYAENEVGLERIIAITTEENKVSIHLLEKLGLTFEEKLNVDEFKKEMLLYSRNFQK